MAYWVDVPIKKESIKYFPLPSKYSEDKIAFQSVYSLEISSIITFHLHFTYLDASDLASFIKEKSMVSSPKDITKKKIDYTLTKDSLLKNVSPEVGQLKIEEGYCKDIVFPIVSFSSYCFPNMEVVMIEKDCYMACSNLTFSGMLLTDWLVN